MTLVSQQPFLLPSLSTHLHLLPESYHFVYWTLLLSWLRWWWSGSYNKGLIIASGFRVRWMGLSTCIHVLSMYINKESSSQFLHPPPPTCLGTTTRTCFVTSLRTRNRQGFRSVPSYKSGAWLEHPKCVFPSLPCVRVRLLQIFRLKIRGYSHRDSHSLFYSFRVVEHFKLIL